MTAQPADRIPVTGPDTGPYEVIHLGGQGSEEDRRRILR